MAVKREVGLIKHVKKATSQGLAGRGRKVKQSTKHMNKHKRRQSLDIEGRQMKVRYRGQGR